MRLPAATAIPLQRTEAASRTSIEEAARGLESQFAQMLIKSMRSASPGDPFGGDSTYRDMYDRQLAQELTRGRGLGLQPMIIRQLGGNDAQPRAPVGPLPLRAPSAPMALPAADTPSGLPLPAGLRGGLALTAASSGTSLPAMAPPLAPMRAQIAATAVCSDTAPLDCSSPEAFVRSVWPHARKAAQELGVPAKALVAQAALETGWGRRLAGGDGKATSHNLFGIKAGGSWSGNRVNATTHEFIDGKRISTNADFRSYGSTADSFADYTRLLRNARYAHARGTGNDVQSFADALQRAGYATDPSYAAKIVAIADGSTMRRALTGLES